MKKFNDSEQITIFNDSFHMVIIPTQHNPNGYVLEPVTNELAKPSITINYSEVRYVNNSSNVFKIGVLRFDKEQQEEIYKNLGIVNWEEILTAEDIKSLATKKNHTPDDYKKILSIKDQAYFERIRSEVVALRNQGTYDLSSRFLDMIEKRLNEFQNGKFNTSFKVQEQKKDNSGVSQKDYDELKAKNEEMQRQFEELKALMMAQLSQNQTTEKTVDTPAVGDKPKSTRGRKPASDKTE
jgi:hypothetical protein